MKKLLVSILVIILLVSVAACSQSKGVTGNKSIAIYPATSTTTTPYMTIPTTTSVGSNSLDAGVSYSGSDSETTTDRMIVRTGDITMLVEDVPATIEQITQLADQYEGYVVSSQSWKSDENLVGKISVRIPADDYDAAVKAINGMAVEVTNQTTSSQDVTEEYTDLSATLTNLEAGEQQLIQIMQKAVTVDDVLAVQKQLTDIRGQIEQTKGRMQYLERTSAMSIINISLQTSKLTVKITADKGIVQAGEIVTFNVDLNGGIAPYSYEWNFGDGSTSTNQTGQHQYKAKGNYTLSLKVTDDKGNSVTETRENYITVISGWDAGNTVSSAWHGLMIFGRVLLNIIIWLGIFSPVWLIIGGIIWWRYHRRKSRG